MSFNKIFPYLSKFNYMDVGMLIRSLVLLLIQIFLHERVLQQLLAQVLVLVSMLILEEVLMLQGLTVKKILSSIMKSPKLQKQLLLFLADKLFPEESVAELVASYKQLKSQNQSRWFILIIILWNSLGLLWAFYIQIKIENIWLPQRKVDE